MLIAIDFDDTIATNRYPYVGELIPFAKEIINALHEKRHKIMLWTVRGTNAFGNTTAIENAKKFCEENEIHIDLYNYNPQHPSNSPKQLFDLAIDDINLGCPLMRFNGRQVVDWTKVANMLIEKGILDVSPVTNNGREKKLKYVWGHKCGHINDLKETIGEDIYDELLNIGIIEENAFQNMWTMTQFGFDYCNEMFN